MVKNLSKLQNYELQLKTNTWVVPKWASVYLRGKGVFSSNSSSQN